MKRVHSSAVSSVEAPLGYQETVDLIDNYFAWKPGFLWRMLIGAYSRYAKPLDEGSYQGPGIGGQPHRLKPVMAGPLTIFALSGAAYRKKALLAARALHLGEIKVVDITPGGGRLTKKKPGLFGSKKSMLGRSMNVMQSLDFMAGGGLESETIQAGHALEVLVEIQRRSPYPIVLIPVAVTSHQLTSRAPAATVGTRIRRLNPWNLVRKMSSLARTTRTGSLTTGRLLILKNWLERGSDNAAGTQEIAGRLRFELGTRLESETRACAGPPRPDIHDLKKIILGDPILSSYMREYAVIENRNLDDTYREARRYIDEIASDYRVTVVRWFAYGLNKIFRHGFEGIEVDKEGLRMLYESDSRKRIVLVCAHKSLIDPLLVGFTMYHAGMSVPYQAAGLNLKFWPVGWLLGHSGAFYLRRTFQGETLYKEVFNAYIRHLLASNFITLLYVEGTRSRDGKLAKPKLGLMGVLADTIKMGVCEDITVMPVYIGYDKVPEEITHVHEMAGGRKVGETTSGMAKLMRDMLSSHGYSYVKFARPQSMRALLDSGGLNGAVLEMSREINDITVLTGRSVVACGLLSRDGEWISKGDMKDAAARLLNLARGKRIPLGDDVEDVSGNIKWFLREGHITSEKRDGEKGYGVSGIGRRYLEYNKNIPVGHFLTDSLLAVSLGSGAKPGSMPSALEIRDNLHFMRRLFDREFVFDRDEELESGIERVVDALSSEDTIKAFGAGAGGDLLRSMLVSKLEGYMISASFLSSMEEGTVWPRDEALQKYFQVGAELLEAGVIRREESISKVTLGNSLKVFKDMNILEELKDIEEDGKKERLLYRRGEEFDELGRIKARLVALLPDTQGETAEPEAGDHALTSN